MNKKNDFENQNKDKTFFQQSIDSFYNCIKLIKENKLNVNFHEYFGSIKKKKIKTLQQNYEKFQSNSKKYLISSYEHLIYLYVISKQDQKAFQSIQELN